jgi:hypothetical protein
VPASSCGVSPGITTIVIGMVGLVIFMIGRFMG